MSAMPAHMVAQQSPVDRALAEGRLQGVVESIRCWKDESSFCIATVRPDDDAAQSITIKGVFPQPATGACYRFTGEWKDDPKWGRQFNVKSLEEVLPSDVHGWERYLAHGPFPQIGPATARAMVGKWGSAVAAVLDSSEAREALDELHGITPARADRILLEWQTQRARSGLMTGLFKYGLTPWQVGRIVARYGDKAADILAEDPYQIIGEIERFGFVTVDAIAGRVGIPKDDLRRARAAVIHLLDEASTEGHCYLPIGRPDTPKDQPALVGIDSQNDVKLSANMLAAGLSSLLQRSAHVIIYQDVPGEAGGGRVALRRLWEAEQHVAERLRALLASPLPSVDTSDGQQALLNDGDVGASGDTGSLTLTPEQAEAVALGQRHRVLVITGGPGTGKTTILQALRTAWQRAGLYIEMAAPTGKAANRMSEATGCPARTVHRLLAWKPTGFDRNELMPIEADVVVVDEASMLDVELAAALLAAIDPARTRLVLVGDVDQLPSVGPGQILHDIIASEAVPVVRLTRIMRQEAGSQIISAAHAVNAGTFRGGQVNNDRGDLYWMPPQSWSKPSIPEATPDDCAAELLRVVTRDLPESGFGAIHDVQVLCPQKRGPVGTAYLNDRLQDTLNPDAPGRPEVRIGLRKSKQRKDASTTAAASAGSGKADDAPEAGRILRLGDKVIQTRNSYGLGVFNGEVGFITNVDAAAFTVEVDFGDPNDPDPTHRRIVAYGRDDLYDLHLAYALTVHKSQGSEFPVVVLPLHTTHYMMLRRRLLYTGITRARECCVLIGTEKALKQAVKCNEEAQRLTRVAELMREGK